MSKDASKHPVALEFRGDLNGFWPVKLKISFVSKPKNVRIIICASEGSYDNPSTVLTKY